MKTIFNRNRPAQHLNLQHGYFRMLLQCLCFVFAFNTSIAQNVGIGIDNPTYKFEVSGTIKGSSFVTTGLVGIGTLSPGYKFHLVDGTFGLSNTTDGATWTLAYNPTLNGLTFTNNNFARLTILNNGNIGLTNTAPAYRLDVSGSIHATANAAIDGTLTVNDGKGVVYNVHGSGQLKYYTRTASFSTGNMAGFALSAETAIGFASAGFTSPPKVFVGDIVSTGGSAGELYRVQLIIYDVTTTSCKARLLNTSPNLVNYSITWNIVCIGE